MGVGDRKIRLKTAFTIPHRFQKWEMTTIEILFGAILDESGEILGIAFFDFGIEIELFSSEKLKNDTNFS